MKKRNKGVTLIALSVTIIVLIILASVATYTGREVIRKANLEEIRTNMLLIQAKAREYVEKANFEMGINPDNNKKTEVRQKIYVNEAKLQTASGVTAPSQIPVSKCYVLTEEAMKQWGLEKITLSSGEKYLIEFKDDVANLSVEIYNTRGYDDSTGTKYSLTELDQIE